jgi:hypothetical protein
MAGKTSKSQEGYYAKYKANKVWEKNRKLRLERVVKAQPNNQQAKDALGGMVYRRKTPGAHTWSHSEKRAAQIYRKWNGLFDRNMFHADPKVSQLALSRKPEVPEPKAKRGEIPPSYGNSFFALGARLQGNWVRAK